jgi:hypothetical protein
VENPPVVLAGELGQSVAGERRGQHVLALGHLRVVAVDGRGGGKDDAPDAGGARGEQDVEGAGDVDFVGGGRIVHGGLDGRERAEVEDVGRALRGGAHRRGVAQVAADEFDGRFQPGEVFETAGGEIVEHAHARAEFHEAPDEVGADEAGAAGDELESAQIHGQCPNELENDGMASGQIRNQTV